MSRRSIKEDEMSISAKGTGTARPRKGMTDGNPVMTQRFGADPYAMVYKDRVYLYMTGDLLTHDAEGNLTENVYSAIRTISVASSADLVNWTDHGEVHAAGSDGIATWGGNSWAPAAAWKTIDGKDRFFLYFANSGNGIAVLQADSPTGPFRDPIGGPLVSRDTPTCAEVTWLFDPAVLVDNDGNAYIYVGGGVPSPDKADNPGTARVAKLGADMVSLDGDPVPIENVAYLFEDSGINRIGDKYIYSYYSNFSMTDEGRERLGFSDGEIIIMESDKPMGPFKQGGSVLKNPGHFFGRGGNNHHCMFEFGGKMYIAYHSRILEEGMGLESGGYRSTNIDYINTDANGIPTESFGTREGVAQIKALDPYAAVPAVTMSNASGIDTESVNGSGYGDMILSGIHTGSWTSVSGVDFGTTAPGTFEYYCMGKGKGTVSVLLDDPNSEPAFKVDIDVDGSDVKGFKTGLDIKLTGKHDLFFVFDGEGYKPVTWLFK